MARLNKPITGRCLCGAITITVTAMQAEVDVCHCAMCQRWGGAFYAGVKGTAAMVTGEDAVSIYRSSTLAERAFCSICGSNLYYRFLPTGNRSFLAGLFSLPPGFRIEQQIFVDEKPDWYDLVQKSLMLTGEQVITGAIAQGFKMG